MARAWAPVMILPESKVISWAMPELSAVMVTSEVIAIAPIFVKSSGDEAVRLPFNVRLPPLVKTSIAKEEPPVVMEKLPIPLKFTVQELFVNVPKLDQFPETLIMPEAGPVMDFEEFMVTLLKELALEPLIAVVPLKKTVPVPAVNVPEFAQLPVSVIFLEPALNVPAAILTAAQYRSAGSVNMPPEPLIFKVAFV